MKKKVSMLLATLFCIVFFASCASTGKNMQEPAISFESGIYLSWDWDAPEGTYTKAVIPDEKTALRAAQAVFAGMVKSEVAQKYVATSIWYDDEDELWSVNFNEGNKAPDGFISFDDSGICIVIQKSDGKVIKIY